MLLNIYKHRIEALEKRLERAERILATMKIDPEKTPEFAELLLDSYRPSLRFEKTETSQLPKMKTDILSLEQSYQELNRLVPVAYAVWKDLVTVNEEAYQEAPPHSCSVNGNKGAELFFKFISPYRYGYILDIGCGPEDIPIYFKGYPYTQLYGIDPLPPHRKHPFHFYQGICEFLPWEDNSFDIAMIGTSFDHVLLLDKALQEIVRVLKHNGMLLLWTSFTPGAPRYNPYTNSIEPIDRFHLFHFDKLWFEELMQEYGFEKLEYFHMDGNHFYSYQQKKVKRSFPDE